MFLRRLALKRTSFISRAFSEQKQQFTNQTIDINDPNKLAEEQQAKKTQADETLKTINEYKDALSYFQQGKYRISDELFKRVVGIMEQSGQQGTDNYTHILKKCVTNQLMLRRYGDAEKYLEKITDVVQAQTTNEAVIYAEYNNLFLHRIRTNLNKAILMGKALLSDSEKSSVPILYQKQFMFNLGTAYLLKGNYVDAKNRLRECLTMEPNNLLKGYALNNLAVASWWHKFPNFKTDPTDEEGNFDTTSPNEADRIYTFQQIDKDFANVLPLLKNSILHIENVANIADSAKKTMFQELLDQELLVPKDLKKYDPDTNLLINSKESGVPLINIGEFLFNTNPEKRNEASFWFKYGLKFFERNDPSNLDRCLITLGLFLSSSKQYIKAEGIFRKCLEMLDSSDSYNKVLCLQLYGNMLTQIDKRQKEGEKLIAEAYAIGEKLPFWSNKLPHVCLPQMDL